MCGRFANDAKVDEMIQEFVAEGGDYRDWRPQFSIAPTQVVPIVRERQHKETGEVTRSVDAAVWNFHPSFMKESKRPQFNTRIETVATNGLWKGAFASSRCLVPMRGYYEWTGEPGRQAGVVPARRAAAARGRRHLHGPQGRRRVGGLDVDHHPRGARRVG